MCTVEKSFINFIYKLNHFKLQTNTCEHAYFSLSICTKDKKSDKVEHRLIQNVIFELNHLLLGFDHKHCMSLFRINNLEMSP